MQKDKLRLMGMKLKGMQIQILLRLDKFPDDWKNFEMPEEPGKSIFNKKV